MRRTFSIKRTKRQKSRLESGLEIISLESFTTVFVFGGDSAIKSVAHLFRNARFVDGSYTHERGALQVIVQERLYALKSLSNARDIGQAFLDIACGACPLSFSITIC